ncbi:MAG: APC family permease [Bryobacteraceae bacterium]
MSSLRNASGATKVVVATTVMLSFISFWRAAAIVLSDLASSAYYVGGIAETAIGKSAPWFILSIMLFSYAVRAVYIESCSMFVRGGVYRVVHEAMGGTLAKFSVSALMFDYVLTGPISAVSAGLYAAGLINESAVYFRHPGWSVKPETFASVFAAVVTIYFWRKNIIGIRESSQKALRIMQVTTVMVVILIAWCLVTIFTRGYQPVPLPTPATIRFGSDALGWLQHSALPQFTVIAILIGLGHSLLAMSGEESLAQVNREIASPKLKNLERAGFVIFMYSMLFTSLVSFFAVMIIPDAVRGKYLDNLIGGLSMFLIGPEPLRLLFHAFVVVVGAMILSGAVNTAIIGSNGVLNRVAEDGVLTAAFRKPHKKYGTSSRLISTIVLLQLITIAVSRGDVYLLGEAYAFGVVWSFAMNGLAVLVLRFKQPGAPEWRVPFNPRIGRTELPIGLGLITLSLFTLAIVNVFTKRVATISGVCFTVAFFITFVVSEHLNRRRAKTVGAQLEEFRLADSDDVAVETVNVRPGNVIVAVRNPNHLEHLEVTLAKTDTRKIDIVVVTVHVSPRGSQAISLGADQVFGIDERYLFSHVVTIAEKAGKHVELLAVPGVEAWLAVIQTAQKLGSARVVAGLSPKYDAAILGKIVGEAWENLPAPRPSLSLEVVLGRQKSMFFNLGPHPPRLWPGDVDLVHQLWLHLADRQFGAKLHHRDVVGVALQRLSRDLEDPVTADHVVDELHAELNQHQGEEPADV